MTRTGLSDFYSTRKKSFEEKLYAVSKRINLVSNIRLVVALLFIAFVYFGFKDYELLYALPLLLILFVILVRKHAVLFREKVHLANLVMIHTQELEALNYNLSSFANGVEFTDAHHPYSHDLDIFGDGSLFQFINRSTTVSGKTALASSLTHPLTESVKIYQQQEAIKELSGKSDFRHLVQASGMEIEEQPNDRQQLRQWLKQPAFIYGKSFYKYFLLFVPSLTLALLIAAFFVPILKYGAIFLALLQWAFLGLHIKKINAFHDYIGRKKNILQKYSQVLSVIQNENFGSAQLQRLKTKATEAGNKVESLASLVNALDARLNFLTNLVVNSLLLYDLQCMYRLEKWKAENANHLMPWLDVISEIEMLSSFGTFAFNNSGFVYGTVNNDLTISAKDLGHPLIAKEECITNDILIGENQSVLIVTGANMAGKSTFLRTLGINLILALNGVPVCASSFSFPVINMRTGMRTADSLKDHQSYFYAELNRLKTIMDELRSDKPLLILLDEILKGTNSTDKQAGSIALVKQLLPHPCLAIIATHDLALGDLETEYPDKVKNYCFEANIENDQLSFDYKLKRGLATRMNATFLMKKMGIIP